MTDHEATQEDTGLVEIRSKSSQANSRRGLGSWLESIRRQVSEFRTKQGIPDAVARDCCLPSEEELQLLVELIGEASLVSEEGEYRQLAVLFLPHDETGAHVLLDVVHCTLIDHPKDAQALDKLSLAKLAPVCVPYRTYLLIDRLHDRTDSETGHFVCWGVADFSTHLGPCGDPQLENDQSDPRFPQLNIALEPDALWLHSLRPGHVEGGWGDKVETWRSSVETVALWRVPAIQKAAERWANEDQWQDAMCHCYRSYTFTFLLEHIVGYMVAKGVGGTILLALNPRPCSPEEEFSRTSLDLRKNSRNPGYRMKLGKGASIAEKAITCIRTFLDPSLDRSKGVKGPEEASFPHRLYPFQPRTQLPHHLRALASFIANLSVVDGATVLDSRLNLLGFGEKIDAKEPQGDLRPSTKEFRHRHGTRHLSAIDWVAAENGHFDRVALVVSTDRKANAIYWEEVGGGGDSLRQVHVCPVIYQRT